MDHTIYLGCYTDQNTPGGSEPARGIYRLNVSEDGKLTSKPVLAAEQVSPAYFYLTKDGSTLYSVSEPEKEKGSMASFHVSDDRQSLTLQSERTAAGKGLCHVTMDPSEKNLIVTCYSEATIQSYPIRSGQITPMFSLRHHMGSGPVVGRQEAAHAHSVTFTPEGDYAVVCDLGMDMLKVYTVIEETGKLHRATSRNFQAPAGSGPRHMVFSPNGKFAYVACELSSEVLVLSYSREKGFSLLEKVSTLSPQFSSASNYPAAIRMTRDGKFLYVSNRGEDTIAAFAADPESGDIRLLASSSTRGWYPRDFILTCDETLLLAVNQMSDNLVIYKRDPDSGRISLTDEQPMPQKPVALVDVCPRI